MKIKIDLSAGPLPRILYLAAALCTAIIGHQIHSSVFWAIVDFFFWPFAWIKWIICQEVTMTIITKAFAWFFK